MRKVLIVQLLLSSLAAHSYSQSAKLSKWTELIDAGKCQPAQQLCTAFTNSPDATQRVESEKCLANVAPCGHEVVQLRGDDNGGGTLTGGYTPEAVNDALSHLNAALRLAPQDLSIHQGRLHVLENAGRYTEMIRALDESCSIYKGTDALEAWMAYSGELYNLGQYQDALAFTKVLDKHYPNSPDVVANIGAFLMLLDKPVEAIPYLHRAVELAPSDPINTWDLGKAYDLTHQNDLADTWYQKGLSLQSDKKQLAESSCEYGHFLNRAMKDQEQACALEKKNCAANDQDVCSTVPQTQLIKK